MKLNTHDFLNALAEGMPPTERMIICGFPGDPGTAPPYAWKPRPWTPGRDINLGAQDNGYISVASFFKGGDGSFRRRAENFAAGRALMIDDVGTKVPLSRVCNAKGDPILRPSAIVETSPRNFQWWYFLREPERNEERFDEVIRAFIHSRLMGQDPGMAGVNRVGRIPGYLNRKAWLVTPKTPLGFEVTLHKLYDVRYSLDDIMGYYELQPKPKPWNPMKDRLVLEEYLVRNKAFTPVYLWLKRRGYLKKAGPDPSGWTEMTCPWRDEHTGSADTGAAVREPSDENGFYGAFRCHHGHCSERGWRELSDWVNEHVVEELNAANERAHVEHQQGASA